jgi:hypothetical protein
MRPSSSAARTVAMRPSTPLSSGGHRNGDAAPARTMLQNDLRSRTSSRHRGPRRPLRSFVVHLGMSGVVAVDPCRGESASHRDLRVHTHRRAALPPERARRGLFAMSPARCAHHTAQKTRTRGVDDRQGIRRRRVRLAMVVTVRSCPSLCPSNCVTRRVRDGGCGRGGRHDLARCHEVDGVDGCGRTHNPSVAGSIPAGPTV